MARRQPPASWDPEGEHDVTRSDGGRLLAGRTILMSGGSRGIGLAIAVAAARQGANAVLLAKTDKPHPSLPGTIHTAKAQIEAAGARAVAVIGDVRNCDDVETAVNSAVETFGGIDVVINNASAIDLAPSTVLPIKKFDLMQAINVRGTWALTTAALPHLLRSPKANVLTLSPPLNLSEHWLGSHPGYTLSKYAMTLLTRSWASEFDASGIAFTCLWPETLIATAAVHNIVGGVERARSADIVAEAAIRVLTLPAADTSGRCFLDAELLYQAGETDLSRYGGGSAPALDIYVDARVEPAGGLAEIESSPDRP
jgi:NAD(P)-dependent dehydrogenase (short-subunit alcohol dehydrogenase family)